ncbi:NAD(P)-binding protein [Sodiomyces alkalinus F11]|uniref:NAD(P)-binding protein n=1 Tax=Sodiomyces alkalinus (strain CBS 110278 / VKM F-3762 / F11) TaxID=1314773 RepID=A0A3N2Q499_SODAK|nr:NAD(P)-binding protein [Sodiomyces alkalinus F11]ROT41579.1 NAD(P)-binding protein [Sodiomyces alkalinus F11]
MASVALFLLLWAWKVNHAMSTTHPDLLKLTKGPWLEEDIKRVYRRVEEAPCDWKPHLPPKRERRYIVVGGSGLVGGYIVLQLLQRGQPPSSIRIVDARPPVREELLAGSAAHVDFVQADITSESSTQAAFAKPWDPSVGGLPLTVFHTAAVIRPSERSPLVYDRCARVNVTGTAHVLAASQRAGADVLIATSSCSTSLRPVTWFNAPWSRWPTNYVQTMTEDDFFAPLRRHEEFFANYARSKAEAERLVCAADARGGSGGGSGGGRGSGGPGTALRTGVIRPGNGIYGASPDVIVTPVLTMDAFPTFSAPWVQNWVHGGNVALAHLDLEAALLGPHADAVAGRPFLVTDEGPPPRFADFYTALRTVCDPSPAVHYPPPVLLLALATVIEGWCLLLWHVPVLTRLGLREPPMPLYLLQRPCLNGAINCIIDDRAARRPVHEGGIGYHGVCTTMEGLCMQLADWNRRRQARGGEKSSSAVGAALKTTIKSVAEVGSDPAARRG